MIRDTIHEYMSTEPSHVTLRAFAGMLETGEATMEDFSAVGVNLEHMAQKYGANNCWTGTTGTAAAVLRRAINARKQNESDCS